MFLSLEILQLCTASPPQPRRAPWRLAARAFCFPILLLICRLVASVITYSTIPPSFQIFVRISFPPFLIRIFQTKSLLFGSTLRGLDLGSHTAGSKSVPGSQRTVRVTDREPRATGRVTGPTSSPSQLSPSPGALAPGGPARAAHTRPPPCPGPAQAALGTQPWRLTDTFPA